MAEMIPVRKGFALGCTTMTDIPCDCCGRTTQTDVAVYRRVPHYSQPHWVVLERMCMLCAILSGWRKEPGPVNPFFSNARQFEEWLQHLSSH